MFRRCRNSAISLTCLAVLNSLVRGQNYAERKNMLRLVQLVTRIEVKNMICVEFESRNLLVHHREMEEKK